MDEPAKTGSPDFDRVGDLLGEAFDADPCGQDRRGGIARPEAAPRARAGVSPRDDPARSLALVWPEIVGPEVAANARPAHLKSGRLVVSASSAVWAQTLQFMSADIKARINEKLGRDAVAELAFRHAGWEDRPGGAPAGRDDADAPALPLSADQEAALDTVARSALPPSMKEQIARAMRAAFARERPDPVR